ncbi:hypothetical protein DSUL_20379 [Desulfovibrionales bacterium]
MMHKDAAIKLEAIFGNGSCCCRSYQLFSKLRSVGKRALF